MTIIAGFTAIQSKHPQLLFDDKAGNSITELSSAPTYKDEPSEGK